MQCQKSFIAGIVWAAARVVDLHDCPTIAKDIIKEAGYTGKEMAAAAAEYDMQLLRKEMPDLPRGQK
jgi:hypothetical protein